MRSGRVLAIYIDPPSQHFYGDRLFDSGTVQYGGADLLAPYVLVRDYFTSHGVPVHTADLFEAGQAEINVYISLGDLSRYRKLARRDDVVASAFFAMECPIVEPRIYRALPKVKQFFRRIMTWSDSTALLPFTGERVECEQFRWPQSREQVLEEVWNKVDRDLLVMINANKLPRLYHNELYTERLRAVEYFHRFGEIDLYGPNWTRMPNRVGATFIPASARRAYRIFWEWRQRRWPDPLYAAAAQASRGVAESKLETLGRYTFAICFENMILKGWITEKIFDCLFAGTVPIYWGAPDIDSWVPPECFIDMRRFHNYDQLRDFLRRLRPSDVIHYREAGREYLESKRFDPFRSRNFLRLFQRIVREDTGIEL